MNSQPCYRVTLADLLFPLWPRPFEVLVYSSKEAPAISLGHVMTGGYILQVWIFLCGRD